MLVDAYKALKHIGGETAETQGGKTRREKQVRQAVS
jgi:hypothetical protein